MSNLNQIEENKIFQISVRLSRLNSGQPEMSFSLVEWSSTEPSYSLIFIQVVDLNETIRLPLCISC